MKIIVYGLNEKELKKQMEDEFSEEYIKYSKRYHGKYLGEFNGEKFEQEAKIVEGAKKFKYLHLHSSYGLSLHSPQRFNKNITETIKKQYINVYGNIKQVSMFELEEE